nr:MAG TPA: hypothetical protein [Caudoviricetes sp.]
MLKICTKIAQNLLISSETQMFRSNLNNSSL